MRNLIIIGALALLALSPLQAAAQQRAAPAAAPAPAAPAAPAPQSAIEGVTSAKVLSIGIGALLGAVAAQAIVAGEGITLVGGAAGGLLAAWWYEVASSGPTRAAMREPAGAPFLARTERLALAR